MPDLAHAIVWIDHSVAKVFFVAAAKVDQLTVQTHATGHHLEHRANITGSGHRGVDRDFFERVAEALAHAGLLLITGPAHAKLELKNYLAEHHPDLSRRVAAVETVDHPSDNQLVALARNFFHVKPL